ncbi:MAG TPA: PEP-CTERM sorting domain-containing protein [Bryobacteraceae bacterium]|nr:PEP-CTERM sorting domain-containing protein [Bryobacteraceae bacterium]
MKVYNAALRVDQVAAETADRSAGKTSNWATPEPGAWRLLAGGLAGAGAWKRLR